MIASAIVAVIREREFNDAIGVVVPLNVPVLWTSPDCAHHAPPRRKRVGNAKPRTAKKFERRTPMAKPSTRTHLDVAKRLVAEARVAGIPEHEIEAWAFPEEKIRAIDANVDPDTVRDLVTTIVA